MKWKSTGISLPYILHAADFEQRLKMCPHRGRHRGLSHHLDSLRSTRNASREEELIVRHYSQVSSQRPPAKWVRHPFDSAFS